jgi:Flp pilus assembly protein TadG
MLSRARRNRNGICSSRGQSLVEFALLLPVLLVLTLGVVDLTRIFADWISLIGGVREAALWASEPPNYSDSSRVHDIVLEAGQLDNARLTVSAPTCNNGSCDATSTTVLIPFVTDILGTPVTLTVETTAPIIDHSGS